MGLNDFFHKRKEPQARPTTSSDFWASVKALCRQHIPKTIQYFRTHNAPKLDWAEQNYAALVSESALDALIEVSKNSLGTFGEEWKGAPVYVGVFGSWSVWVTVVPTASDAAFLERCPDRRFEPFIESCARKFRTAEKNWKSLNYAQWLLLLEPDHEASIHLFTLWNSTNHLQWVKESAGGIFKGPPAIHLPRKFIVRTCRSSSIVWSGNNSPLSMNRPRTQRRSARCSFSKSVTSEEFAFPQSPIQIEPLSRRNAGWLDRVLRSHRIDCDILQHDVPLWVGMPEKHREVVEAYCREVHYHGLNSKSVTLFSEAELPLLHKTDAGFTAERNHEVRTYLGGGGLSLAKWIETGGLARAWRSGTRCLLLCQTSNLEARLDPRLLAAWSDRRSAGIMEVVDRAALKGSMLVVLSNGRRDLCVDDRRLRSKETDHLRKGQLVGTGSFWIDCKSLASAFGVAQEALDSEWDTTAWSGRISDPLLAKRGILCRQGENVGFVVPLWEVLMDLQLAAVQVPPDRVRLT